MYKGRVVGAQIRSGQLSPKIIPTWWVGKGIRKLTNKLKITKEKK